MAVIYQQLCPVLYGNDAIAEMAKRAAADGRKKAFIVCDKGVRAIGAADRVAGALKAEGVDSFIFDDILPDAPEDCVNDLAARMAEFGVSVYEIRPGVIRTDMTAGVTEKYDRLLAGGLTLEKRWGLPEDIGKTAAALATGQIPYATGQVIKVDGGMTIQQL